MRHNQIRDTITDIIKETCYDVRVEPALLPVKSPSRLSTSSNTARKARLDISARGVWSSFVRTFVDIRVSHPNCPSNAGLTLQQIFQRNEPEKKSAYNERVMLIEKGNFTPLVSLTNGAMSPECVRFIKQMAHLIQKKRKQDYPQIINYVRTRIRFAVLRSTGCTKGI